MQAIEQGWSRATLEARIIEPANLRHGASLAKFNLAAPHAQLAIEALTDPYQFDFLGPSEEAHEHDIENALSRHITRFLLELGSGFAFVGRQHRIEVAGDEFSFYLAAVDAEIK
jgi:predicted nuclease of restriction endonuclease-like (RecB) superfamily